MNVHFLSYCIVLEKNWDVPTLTDIWHMRSDVNSAYTYFANTILPKIVCPTKWRGQVTKRTISQLATPTDEAFGLFLLENSWENWIETQRLVHEDNNKSGANKTPFIYSLQETKGGSRKCWGWSNAGMRRYRELVNMVWADRENNADKDNLKASYKTNCPKEREVALNSLKRKRNSDDGVRDPVVEVPNDLDLMEEVKLKK